MSEEVSCTLHFRRLRKPKGDAALQQLKADLTKLVGLHNPLAPETEIRGVGGVGGVRRVSYLHGRGQALVEMVSEAVAARVLQSLRTEGHENISYSYKPRSKQAQDSGLSAAATKEAGSSTAQADDPGPGPGPGPGAGTILLQSEGEGGKGRLECQRSLAVTVRAVVTRDAHERCLSRRRRKRGMQRQLESVPPQHQMVGHPRDAALYARIYELLGEPAEAAEPPSSDATVASATASFRAAARVCPAKLLSPTLCDGSGSGSGSGGSDRYRELVGLFSAVHTPLARRLRTLVCWESVRCGRVCDHTDTDTDPSTGADADADADADAVKGKPCQLLHVPRPVTELPPTMREYAADDSFTEAAEAAEVKCRVNEYVAAQGVAALRRGHGRCLLLDGKNCNTSRAVLQAQVQTQMEAGGGSGARTAADIFVPNYCASTAAHMQAEHGDVCSSYFGSVRAFLDDLHYSAAASAAAAAAVADDDGGNFSSPLAELNFSLPGKKQAQAQAQAQAPGSSQKLAAEMAKPAAFGLVYLDYCCRFSCGYTSVEKSPREDLAALFRYRLLCAHACIVICTAVATASGSHVDSASASAGVADAAEVNVTSISVPVEGVATERTETDEEQLLEKEKELSSVVDTVKLLARDHGLCVVSSETAFRYGQLEVHAVQLGDYV